MTYKDGLKIKCINTTEVKLEKIIQGRCPMTEFGEIAYYKACDLKCDVCWSREMPQELADELQKDNKNQEENKEKTKMKVKAFVNGVELEVEITEEQGKLAGLIKDSPLDVKQGKLCCYVDRMKQVTSYCGEPSEREVKNGLVCKDREIMSQRALRELLNCRLEKFAYDNGAAVSKEELRNREIKKFYVRHNVKDMFWAESFRDSVVIGVIYFKTEEVAEMAITEICEPFLKEFPEFI